MDYVRCDEEQRKRLLNLMSRREGVTIDEALAAVPIEMTPEMAMVTAQNATMRHLLHSLGGWSVLPDLGGRGGKVYRHEGSMTTNELHQVERLQQKLLQKAKSQKKRFLDRIEALEAELRAMQRHMFPNELKREIKALERTVQSMGAP